MNKYVTQYEHMRKWIVENLSKFQERAIKITGVDLRWKPLILFNILRVVAA